jgi:hypothetical protein
MIAKSPSAEDEHDVIRWEAVAMTLARWAEVAAKLDLPQREIDAMAPAFPPHPRLDVDGPKTQDMLEFSAHQPRWPVAAGVMWAPRQIAGAALTSAWHVR